MITDSSGEDDVGRTVAIIVGVLAGAAILIVLLSICRKFIGILHILSSKYLFNNLKFCVTFFLFFFWLYLLWC